MIIIRKEILEKWLDAIDRNQTWLAAQIQKCDGTGYIDRSYLNQILNNKCPLGISVLDQLLLITRMPFEKLFFNDGKIDTREFYGRETFIDGKFLNNKAYKKELKNLDTK